MASTFSSPPRLTKMQLGFQQKRLLNKNYEEI